MRVLESSTCSIDDWLQNVHINSRTLTRCTRYPYVVTIHRVIICGTCERVCALLRMYNQNGNGKPDDVKMYWCHQSKLDVCIKTKNICDGRGRAMEIISDSLKFMCFFIT